VPALLQGKRISADAPTNLGWGSKRTQFHGSLGKSSALASQTITPGCSPDDDLLPRISWRGDGAYFVVSSLSPTASGEIPQHRTLRIYSQTGALQSTSEAVAGLEHPVAWRSSGGLIAGTQRFGGFAGAGVGREGRHDVIFFERNGLRKGEFGIRCATSPGCDLQTARKSVYRINEVSWSPDSNVLALWIQAEHEDIGALEFSSQRICILTAKTCSPAVDDRKLPLVFRACLFSQNLDSSRGRYLKQEICSPHALHVKPSRFTSVMWHPEQDLHLILTTACKR
jgi:elongator complex protein 1